MDRPTYSISNKGINVLSLFDGISCGQIALERAGIEVNKYFASEIDKHAIKVTQNNYPNTIQLGDVGNVSILTLSKIDLLIAGSPCQGFSFAGKQLNFEDHRSKLFFEFVRILKDIRKTNPDIKFLLENVKMKKESQDAISNILGVEPIEINSSFVSAQLRKRLYWTNIPKVTQPEDKLIKLQDILISGFATKDKSYCVMASAGPSNRPSFLKRHIDRSMGNCKLKTKKNKFDSSDLEIMSVVEVERLQTLPDNYTNGILESKRFHAIGNGWTVDVIAHIFSFLPKKLTSTE